MGFNSGFKGLTNPHIKFHPMECCHLGVLCCIIYSMLNYFFSPSW